MPIYPNDIDLHSRRYLTENKNLLGSVAFKLDIDKTFVPNVEYFITRVQLPQISVEAARHAGPNRNAWMPGDKVEYSELECEFMVDEDMNNWQEIHDWMLGQVVGKDAIHEDLKHRDIILSIMSSHNNVVKQIQFVDAFPIAMTGLEFNLQNTEVQYLSANVTFRYSYFKVL